MKASLKVTPHRGVVYTPLRYPGGKTRLYRFLRETIASLPVTVDTYVEPFAGGAGAAASLLVSGDVPKIWINDLDPAIFAFWQSVTQHTDELLARLRDTPLTLDERDRQRAVYRAAATEDCVSLGFAALYLNRTSRSGVMNAGVIGGRAQEGRYKIDARFNRAELASRIEALGAVADRMTVTNEDGVSLIADIINREGFLTYADPPYFAKGSYLYLNAFKSEDHESLAQVLRGAPERLWILTYDDAPEIRSLYRGFYQGTFELPYSAHGAALARELMVMSGPVALASGAFHRSHTRS